MRYIFLLALTYFSIAAYSEAKTVKPSVGPVEVVKPGIVIVSKRPEAFYILFKEYIAKTSADVRPQVIAGLDEVTKIAAENKIDIKGRKVAAVSPTTTNIQVATGFIVTKKPAIIPPGMQVEEIPPGNIAKVLYVGPNENIRPTYDILIKWSKDNDKQIGIIWETYISPASTPNDKMETMLFSTIKQ